MVFHFSPVGPHGAVDWHRSRWQLNPHSECAHLKKHDRLNPCSQISLSALDATPPTIPLQPISLTAQLAKITEHFPLKWLLKGIKFDS